MKYSHSPRAAELSPHEFRQVPSVTLRYKTSKVLSCLFFSGLRVGPAQIPPCRLTMKRLHSFVTKLVKDPLFSKGYPLSPKIHIAIPAK